MSKMKRHLETLIGDDQFDPEKIHQQEFAGMPPDRFNAGAWDVEPMKEEFVGWAFKCFGRKDYMFFPPLTEFETWLVSPENGFDVQDIQAIYPLSVVINQPYVKHYG